MANKELVSKVANVPLARPGFDAFSMSAPVLVQMNPNGKWKNSTPENLDEESLRKVIQKLIDSKTVNATQTFCKQCVSTKQNDGSKSNYVPVILMPVCPANECPFDMGCAEEKIKETEKTQKRNVKKKESKDSDHFEDAGSKKPKKRSFVLQRLTDFDLLSQW